MVLRDEQRCPATACDRLHLLVDFLRDRITSAPSGNRVAGPFADAVSATIDTAHARFCREWHEGPLTALGLLGGAEAAGQSDDGAALRGFVGPARKVGRAHQLFHRNPASGEELGGLAVAQRDGPGLVEQKGIHVAGGLDGTPRHGEHVLLKQPVDAGDADRAQKAADRGWDETDEERDEDRDFDGRPREDRIRLQRHDGDQEDQRQAREQDVECNLVGSLLTRGTLDKRDHAVEERLARVLGDLDDDAVAEDARATGDSASVATGLTNDRC